MSINRPSWPHSAIQVLAMINRELADRLNADPAPQALWKVESGQYALSGPGSMRIIWSFIGGSIQRGWQVQGPDQPAKCVGIRKLRLRAEIRTSSTNTSQGSSSVGITPDVIQRAEEVIRALVVVWDHQRPADYDEEEQSEDWGSFTSDPGQREVICSYTVTILLPVLDDPNLTKTITSVDSTGLVQQ